MTLWPRTNGVTLGEHICILVGHRPFDYLFSNGIHFQEFEVVTNLMKSQSSMGARHRDHGNTGSTFKVRNNTNFLWQPQRPQCDLAYDLHSYFRASTPASSPSSSERTARATSPSTSSSSSRGAYRTRSSHWEGRRRDSLSAAAPVNLLVHLWFMHYA